MSVGFALAAALAFALATVGQQRAAARQAGDRGGQFVGRLLSDRLWLLATAGTAVAYGLQAAALAVGSVLVVQPILVLSLVFALPLSARIAGQPTRRASTVTALVLVLSLASFLLLTHPQKGLERGSGTGWFATAAVVIGLSAICLYGARRATGALRASLVAIVVGVLAGVLAVLTKAAANALLHGPLTLLTTPETYGLAAVGLAGVYLQQVSFQTGTLQSSLPIIAVLEQLVAALLGFALLHERLGLHGVRTVGAVTAAVFVVATTVLLARMSARTPRSAPAAPVDSESAVSDGSGTMLL